jgi:hypothetical protein
MCNGRLTRLLEDGACPLLAVVQEAGVKLALEREVPRLLDFVVARAGELADIALGAVAAGHATAQAACLGLLVAQVPALTARLLASPALLSRLAAFAAADRDLAPADAAAFSRVMHFLIQESNGAVLRDFPEAGLLFARLLRHASSPAVFHLMRVIVNTDREAIICFLEDSDATGVLLQALRDDDRMNVRILKLMAELLGSIDADSVLLSPFETREPVLEILALALASPDPQVSAAAYSVLCELSGLFENYEAVDGNEDVVLESVCGLLLSKISDICAFVLSSERFLEPRARAVDLVCALIVWPVPVPDPIVALAVGLTDKVFRWPVNSALHVRFFTLLARIARVPEQLSTFFRESGIRTRIITVFRRRSEIQASYWGMLASIATMETETTHPNLEWKRFLEKTIDPIRDTISIPYGGLLPSREGAPSNNHLGFPAGRSRESPRPPQAAAIDDDEEESDYEEDVIDTA